MSEKFSDRVIRLALSIPPGRVTTYGLLAVAAGGHPMMSRMITTILSKYPDQPKIPYHRIVYASGRVWLGTPKSNPADEGGLDPFVKKRLALYKKEGIKLDHKNKIVHFENILFLPR